MKNLFTRDEIMLCTYAARFSADDFGGTEAIERLGLRSISSIQMKIQNIACMLDEHGIDRENAVTPLTGLPHGRTGRNTNWEWVQEFTVISKADLLARCLAIIHQNTQSDLSSAETDDLDDPFDGLRINTGIPDLSEHFDDYRFGRRTLGEVPEQRTNRGSAEHCG